ncbi:MAG: IPT/TIG domain-containing protein [Treponema sp.]|nr:IPT/TIG domain-containing protein [Treponema sp.]
MNKIYIIAGLAALLFSCKAKSPVIESIDPKIGRMGEIITLRGVNFGTEQEEAYITIAGTSPTRSSYHAWQDDHIMVRVPESGESGLVYVHVKGKKSNGVLFSNSAAVPRPVEGGDLGFEPGIISVNPRTGAAGTLITITGNNFGSSRENGGVFFTWEFEPSLYNPFAPDTVQFIEVSETEFGYEYWSDREIRIRLPDGAVSGNFEIRTSRGKSKPVVFDISGRPGSRAFRDKRSYTISYSVDIKILEATRPNTLYLWVPQPVTSPSQRNVNLISTSGIPFIENYRGTSLYKLDNLNTGASSQINLSYQVDVYSQEAAVNPQLIRLDERSPLDAYTQSSPLIPSDNPRIKSQVDAILGRERNPYTRARLIYEWFIREMTITESLPQAQANWPVSATDIMENKQTDTYTAALLFCAMSRAAGLPSIPTAGVLISRDQHTMRHYWAEIWINGFGWLPVDPAMGAGAVGADFISRQNSASFYFGGLDNMRIIFSRGELSLSQMETRGRLVSHSRSYSLQNIWEEAAGGIESYSSLWGDIIITGMYIQ